MPQKGTGHRRSGPATDVARSTLPSGGALFRRAPLQDVTAVMLRLGGLDVEGDAAGGLVELLEDRLELLG
jgi:hypothetical protein